MCIRKWCRIHGCCIMVNLNTDDLYSCVLGDEQGWWYKGGVVGI